MKNFKLMKGVLACLLSLVLVVSGFGSVGLHADTATTTTTVVAPTAQSADYDPMTDCLVASSAAKVVYVLKAEKGNTIKKGSKCFSLSTTATENTLTAIGVKSTAKDAYLYVCDKEFEEDGKNINANLVIKGQAAKKITGVIDYTKADDKDSTTVLSIKATDKNKKEIENPTAIWSEDGTTWKAANEFKGSNLVKMLEAGGGTIQVKMLGTDTAPYVRTSKAIKVKIAKQGKAPTVKVDVKKDTFSIKNGMDFALFTKSGENYTLVDGWKTVLPVLKTAATKTLDDSIVSTGTEYKPVGKKDAKAAKAKADNDGKVSYTSTKVKALSYDKMVSSLSGATTGEYYIGVRTSATEKKPASAVTYFKFEGKTEAPIVYTASCVSGEYLISSGTDFPKKGILLKNIANYNGENGTTGYDDSFQLNTTAGTGADKNVGSYEFAIVNKTDWDATVDTNAETAAIDWSTVSWKKLDPAKTKINAKLKTKYGTTAKSGITATLTATTKPDGFTAGTSIPQDVKTVILVRRAGIKGKTAEDTVVASNIIPLYVIKDGKDYNIYSTVAIGEVAYPYTVEFYKWSASGEGTNATYTWVKDDSLTVTGWGKNSTETPLFPTVENADFFELGANSISGEKLTLSSGKWSVAVAEAQVTKKVAIREYANVKVVSSLSLSGDTTGTATEADLTNISNGKLKNETTVKYYVGEGTFSISGMTTPTATNYTVSVKSGSGDVTPAGSATATVDANGELTFNVNTAKEVTIKVPYVKTPDTYAWATEGENATVTPDSGCIANNLATYGKDITFAVSASANYTVTKVEFKVGTGSYQEIAKTGDKYKIDGSRITGAVTVKVTTQQNS
jgi:hypothetical protein